MPQTMWERQSLVQPLVLKATVVGYELATTTDPLTLYVKYTATGSNNTSTTFSDNEDIQANGVVGGIVANSSSATTCRHPLQLQLVLPQT